MADQLDGRRAGSRRRARGAAALLAAVIAVGACGVSDAASTIERAEVTVATVPETVPAPSSSAPTSTVAPPGPTPGMVAANGGRPGAWTVTPYVGLGSWLDAFDWSVSFARSVEHAVGVEAVDDMADQGVQTLYIQASRWNAETDVLEPERLQPILDRAHARGMSVIAWYLPTLVDLSLDQRRLAAIAALDVDGLAIDIESRDVEDVTERNRRLIELSAWLDDGLGDRALGAIVLEPVIMEDVNPNYWPGFPWAELAPYYDVWLPMGYWTNRTGQWRSAEHYTATNIERLRARIDQPDALVHAIGGVGDKATVEDLVGMVDAATRAGVIGGSLYDYRTSRPEFWEVLRALRR